MFGEEVVTRIRCSGKVKGKRTELIEIVRKEELDRQHIRTGIEQGKTLLAYFNGSSHGVEDWMKRRIENMRETDETNADYFNRV